jgi:hypothetical protein
MLWLTYTKYLVQYGFVMDDKENQKISLHPLIQDMAMLKIMPSVSNCRAIIDSLHLICLTHGLEIRRPNNIIQSIFSITKHVLVDEPEAYFLFLQNMFTYLNKYLVMEKHGHDSIYDRVLLLDNKAELFVIRKDYGNSLNIQLESLELLQSMPSSDIDAKSASL